jgi:hypothetical protein
MKKGIWIPTSTKTTERISLVLEHYKIIQQRKKKKEPRLPKNFKKAA